MKRLPRIRIGRLASPALALAISLGAIGWTRPVSAQEPAPAGGEQEEGRPLDGYIATTILCGLAMWAVGKSARR